MLMVNLFGPLLQLKELGMSLLHFVYMDILTPCTYAVSCDEFNDLYYACLHIACSYILVLALWPLIATCGLLSVKLLTKIDPS